MLLHDLGAPLDGGRHGVAVLGELAGSSEGVLQRDGPAFNIGEQRLCVGEREGRSAIGWTRRRQRRRERSPDVRDRPACRVNLARLRVGYRVPGAHEPTHRLVGPGGDASFLRLDEGVERLDRGGQVRVRRGA